MNKKHLTAAGTVFAAAVFGLTWLNNDTVPSTAAISAPPTEIPLTLQAPTTTPHDDAEIAREISRHEIPDILAARAEAERIAAEQAAATAAAEEQRRAEAARVEQQRQQNPAPAPAAAPPAAASSSGDDATRLCIMRKESGGNYQAVSPGGTYHGAYQFSRPTGDATAKRMGRPDLAGTPVSRWTPAEQDQAFWTLWNGGKGRSNWPTAKGC